jgi:ectoine hydroxylase-related dioxygenase (phytanoyl-CoA dioxygenase family)
MHQDLAYWGLGEINGILTAWLALSPATPQSGCMDFVKGSHKNPIVPYEDSFDELNLLSRGQEFKVDAAEEDKSSGALATGKISLHHGLMIHGSGANTSHNRGIGVVMPFLSPHVKKPNNAPYYGVPLHGR